MVHARVVEEPAAAGVAAGLQALRVFGTHQLDSRRRHLREYPCPVPAYRFLCKFEAGTFSGHSAPHRRRPDPSVKKFHVAGAELDLPRPLVEDPAQVVAKRDQFLNRQWASTLGLHSVPMKEPVLPLPRRDSVAAVAGTEVIRERAVDEIDASNVARIGRDGRLCGVKHIGPSVTGNSTGRTLPHTPTMRIAAKDHDGATDVRTLAPAALAVAGAVVVIELVLAGRY